MTARSFPRVWVTLSWAGDDRLVLPAALLVRLAPMKGSAATSADDGACLVRFEQAGRDLLAVLSPNAAPGGMAWVPAHCIHARRGPEPAPAGLAPVPEPAA